MILTPGALGLGQALRASQSGTDNQGAVISGTPVAQTPNVVMVVGDLIFVTVHVRMTKDGTPGSVSWALNLSVDSVEWSEVLGAGVVWQNPAAIGAAGIWNFSATVIGRCDVNASPTMSLIPTISAGQLAFIGGIQARVFRFS